MAVQTESMIVVGLGNPILTDDGVGWRVVQAVREVLDSQQLSLSVQLVEASVGGLSLAEMLIGHDRAIIVDAIMTGHNPPGTVSQFKISELPGTLNTASAHDTNLVTALRALQRFGAAMPDDRSIDIVAIEAEDVWTFGETCTPTVAASIPRAVSVILDLIAQP